MTHPLFARLEEQMQLVEAELENLNRSQAKSRRLKARNPTLYDEWTHCAALAEGIRSVYTALESIMAAVADEIDRYEPPRTADWHERLVDQLSVRVEGVREAVLEPQTKALLHELRRFRHVVHHNYAQKLELEKVEENHARLRRAVAAFRRDYRRLAGRMQAAE